MPPPLPFKRHISHNKNKCLPVLDKWVGQLLTCTQIPNINNKPHKATFVLSHGQHVISTKQWLFSEDS